MNILDLGFYFFLGVGILCLFWNMIPDDVRQAWRYYRQQKKETS